MKNSCFSSLKFFFRIITLKNSKYTPKVKRATQEALFFGPFKKLLLKKYDSLPDTINLKFRGGRVLHLVIDEFQV